MPLSYFPMPGVWWGLGGLSLARAVVGIILTPMHAGILVATLLEVIKFESVKMTIKYQY